MEKESIIGITQVITVTNVVAGRETEKTQVATSRPATAIIVTSRRGLWIAKT